MKRLPPNPPPSPSYDRQAWRLAVILANVITIGTLLFLGYRLTIAFNSPEPFDLNEALVLCLFFVILFLSTFDVIPSIRRWLFYRLIARVRG